MPEKEEIECYTGERETNSPFQDECKQCVFEALCLTWDSRTQWKDTTEVEKISENS
jgi:hypothetical protein